ncbi:MAG: DUF2148 domain-containing protein [Candidatus Micrarchaeota archaeon]
MEDGNALRIVAELMLLSAKTAPKALGRDVLTAKIASGNEKERIAVGMESIKKKNWERDAKTIRKAELLILIGVKSAGAEEALGGRIDVSDIEPQLKGEVCPTRLIDLGIAVGSAVKTASLHNVDNRVMWRAGVIAASLGVIDAAIVLAIPLSASEKSIFFDR